MTQQQRNEFGRRLAVNRQAMGLSQRQLAKRLDVDNSCLSHLEAGRRLPSLDLLYKIAAELGGHPGGYLP